ncbi:Actin-related protein 2/3 complex subunit 5 [Aphelenchoides besseyi]|nr:Actin-related protein 2/3 complex subunit 5 [Aphelenchoides besseyi]KAI6225707.1 Actin-related protein 2/3 complex subunit 5 [Aphelenchoides besseyi]
MSKNLRDTSYRKFNIDELENDPSQFDRIEEPLPSIFGDGSGPNQAEIKKLVEGNQVVEALTLALRNPPFKADQATKNTITAIVSKALTAIKQSEIDGIVKKFDEKQVALLLKYVYKAMEQVTDSQSSQLLCAWHSSCTQAAGSGSICHAITSRYHF